MSNKFLRRQTLVFYFMVKKWLLFVFPMLMLIAGCAVNDKGFMDLRYFENETSYLRIQESWGGYLSTHNTDRGLVLGHTNRTRIYPKFNEDLNLSVDEFLQRVDDDNYVEINAQDVDMKKIQPFVWIEKNQGIMFHANPLKVGMTAGVESKSILRLPTDFDGVFIVEHYKGGDVKAGVQESFQLK